MPPRWPIHWYPEDGKAVRMGNWLTLPNVFSLARLMAAAPVAWLIVSGRFGWALALLLVAGATDGIDGYLARRFGWKSAAGAYLDPIADKLLLGIIYVALGVAGVFPWWLVWLVLGRDIVILGGAGLLWRLARYRRFPPSIWGKISTTLQIAAALVALLDGAAPSAAMNLLLVAGIYLAAAATVGSGLHYVARTAGWLSLSARIDGTLPEA